MPTVFEIAKAVSAARVRKLRLDLHIKRLGIKRAEDKYQDDVKAAFMLWYKQWKRVEPAAFKYLYSVAQRMPVEKQKAMYGIQKAMYDIPRKYQRPIERAVRISPDETAFIAATFDHLDEVYNRTCQGMSQALGTEAAFKLI